MLQLKNTLGGALAVVLWATTGSVLAADPPAEPAVAAERAARQHEPDAARAPQPAHAEAAPTAEQLAEQDIALMVASEVRQSLSQRLAQLTPQS